MVNITIRESRLIAIRIEKINYKIKLENFVSEAKNKLFDVAFCKCIMEFTCTCRKKHISCDCMVVMKCDCEKEKKYPKLSLCTTSELVV